MIIKLNNYDKSILDSYFQQKNNNVLCSEIQNDFLSEAYDYIHKEDIDTCKKDGHDEKESMKFLFYSEAEIDEEEPLIQELEQKNEFGNFNLLSSKKYTDNPYYATIKSQHVKDKNYILDVNRFEPYECFTYNDTLSDSNNCYAEITPLGYFNESVPYLYLSKNDVIWMSITPHEINTMEKAIEKAHGKVITFGLGLGYYAFMTSIKEEVDSVTIVENDQSIISLFEKNLLPSFPMKEKIKIVKADAFHYMEKAKDFDTLFIDIYHTPEDALPLYLKFKRLEKQMKFPYIIDYWIEDSILCLLRRYVLTLLEEYYQGLTEQDYLNDSDIESKILKALYFALKDYHFSSIKEIDDILSDKGLIELAKGTKI